MTKLRTQSEENQKRLTNILPTFNCESKMDIQHAMSCKKGGFITIRNNDIRDLTANLLTEVSEDVDVEPQILPITDEKFINQTANTSEEARVDMKSRGLFVRGQDIFSM